MSSSTEPRRFLVVGEPFFRLGDQTKHFASSAKAGDVVILAAGEQPDEDGDVSGRIEGADRVASVSIEALVEIDADGYPVKIADFVLDGEGDLDHDHDDETEALLVALYPIAVVVLGRAL